MSCFSFIARFWHGLDSSYGRISDASDRLEEAIAFEIPAGQEEWHRDILESEHQNINAGTKDLQQVLVNIFESEHQNLNAGTNDLQQVLTATLPDELEQSAKRFKGENKVETAWHKGYVAGFEFNVPYNPNDDLPLGIISKMHDVETQSTSKSRVFVASSSHGVVAPDAEQVPEDNISII